ncbi:MAG: hypothetical protein ABI666_08925 [Ferruginibacter sp.]
MIKKVFYRGICSISLLVFYHSITAQESPRQADTFFLAKKKGLLGRFGRSISTTPPDDAPVKLENPFLKYKGKIIRSIVTVRLGFEYDIDDTNQVKKNFGIAVANAIHKNSSDNLIQRNLFFKEGNPLYPYLLADNERYLRDLVYIKDARILVDYAEGSTDSVDVVILTKDVFSIGGNFSNSGTRKARLELREENFMGSGTRLLISGYYEKQRFPQTGFGAELIRRNIGGSFIDWTSGYKDFNPAFSSGRNQETIIYTRFEKPLVTAYIPSTGALEWSYQRTRNVYDSDSLYRTDIKYANYNLDAWFGYSLDSKRSLYANKEIRVHRFIALRGFKQHFLTLPLKYKTGYDYRFTDFTGALASLNIFKQIFYKTSFIYGFGRNEDIPEGFSAALTTGYVKKQNVKRPYSGLDISLGNFRKKGFYSNYMFRIGGYFYQKRFEDVDLLFSVDHFTRLRKLSKTWYNRVFLSTAITAQVNPVLNAPLYLNSDFGLPYFNNGSVNSDLRATVKGESVFYNTKKLLGFRFAPFMFANLSLLKPTKLGLQKSDLFSAFGGGIRTRNENLVYGTIELKAYYFPRLNGDMNPWKIELNSNIRFKYKSSFISRPDFIVAN